VTATPKQHTTYQFQTDLAVEALKTKPDMRNQELNNYVRNRLLESGYVAPQFVSNSVFTRARTQLGIVSTRGRPAGSKNVKTVERKAQAEAKMKVIEAETTRSLNAFNATMAGIPSHPSTGLFTGSELINVYRGPVAPTLAELLRPVEKLMRDRGISSITLDVDGLHVTRTITESVVL
jgi:hypothetical protein